MIFYHKLIVDSAGRTHIKATSMSNTVDVKIICDISVIYNKSYLDFINVPAYLLFQNKEYDKIYGCITSMELKHDIFDACIIFSGVVMDKKIKVEPIKKPIERKLIRKIHFD